jgi:hypothetical protein
MLTNSEQSRATALCSQNKLGLFVSCAELERWPFRGDLMVKYRCHAFGGAVGAQTMRNRHKAPCSSEMNSRFVEPNQYASILDTNNPALLRVR